MIVNAQKLEAVLQKPLDQSVYYFFSTEEYLVRQAARRAVDSLCRESGEDATVIPGPVPDLDHKTERILLHGEITSPTNLPPHCRFYKRCYNTCSCCSGQEEPSLLQVGGDHFVACHHYTGADSTSAAIR